jgi:pimeloyl-ACP methyl ester carboxylesterase
MGQIVAEFLPPSRTGKKLKVIILCDGMPSVPRKQPLMEFLSRKGYWVFYPRWRGAWESDGRFLEKSPHEDILDIVSELSNGVTEIAFGEHLSLSPDEIFVIGGSFGGTAALLASLDHRIKKVVASCPVVDWAVLEEEQPKETSNPNYVAYLKEAFGNAYRLSERNWNKLRNGVFFSPVHHVAEFTPSKIMMFHAKDDPYIPWKMVDRFAREAGIKLNLMARGGHLKTESLVQGHWAEIGKFLSR